MSSPNTAARPLAVRAATAALALTVVAGAAGTAAAETRVRARYAMTMAGFDIGTATLQSGLDRKSYDINLSMRMTGLAKFITGGKGAVTARGALGDARVTPTAYALNTRTSDKGQVIRFALAGGAVRQLSVEPPPKSRANIVPVSEADKRGVLDPLSAIIMPVTGGGEALNESACNRKLPIFDGRQRFDITLRYDRMETAKPDRSENADPDAKAGYEGKVVVCRASYKAISGHRPGRESVTFMENNRDIEVWLAPVAGAKALMPWKISVRTQYGTLVVTATSFVVDGGGAAGGQKGVDL